jgi:hypothetical protein
MVADYFGATQDLFSNNVSIHWPNDRGPPPNTPFCGFLNDNPACAKKGISNLDMNSKYGDEKGDLSIQVTV